MNLSLCLCHIRLWIKYRISDNTIILFIEFRNRTLNNLLIKISIFLVKCIDTLQQNFFYILTPTSKLFSSKEMTGFSPEFLCDIRKIKPAYIAIKKKRHYPYFFLRPHPPSSTKNKWNARYLTIYFAAESLKKQFSAFINSLHWFNSRILLYTV